MRATLPRDDDFSRANAAGIPAGRPAQAMASAGDAAVTDEAMLVERAGFDVHLVDGEAANIKVTTPRSGDGA